MLIPSFREWGEFEHHDLACGSVEGGCVKSCGMAFYCWRNVMDDGNEGMQWCGEGLSAGGVHVHVYCEYLQIKHSPNVLCLSG